MKPLPAPSQPSAVLSFDFDGTLHDPAAMPPVPPDLFARLARLREDQQIVWGINTGRSMPQLVEGLIESRFPFLPDWAVACEREIYLPNALGRFEPHRQWNHRCDKEIHSLFKQARRVLKRVRHEIEEHTGAQWIEMPGEPAGFISRTLEEMEWIVQRITPITDTIPQLAWQRNSIYLRFGHRDFHKGTSLGEIARLYQLPPARCFAMGDGYNDLEMLDPAHAGMTACPANAVDVIRAKITATGGLITRAPYGAGALEALDRFFPLLQGV